MSANDPKQSSEARKHLVEIFLQRTGAINIHNGSRSLCYKASWKYYSDYWQLTLVCDAHDPAAPNGFAIR